MSFIALQLFGLAIVTGARFSAPPESKRYLWLSLRTCIEMASKSVALLFDKDLKILLAERANKLTVRGNYGNRRCIGMTGLLYLIEVRTLICMI